MNEIQAFENHSYDSELDFIHPSPSVVYQCNLKYLGELCKLIADKYNQEYVWGDTEEETESNQYNSDGQTYLDVIKDFLEQKGLLYDSYMLKEIKLRRDGKRYTLRDHVKGMIYSMLSAQTKWYRIENHLTEIDKMFYGYDPDSIMTAEPSQFVEGLFNLKCGNRSTKKQMDALKYNIQNFQRIQHYIVFTAIYIIY